METIGTVISHMVVDFGTSGRGAVGNEHGYLDQGKGGGNMDSYIGWKISRNWMKQYKQGMVQIFIGRCCICEDIWIGKSIPRDHTTYSNKKKKLLGIVWNILGKIIWILTFRWNLFLYKIEMA